MSRKLSDAAKERKTAYDIKYAKENVVRKFIPFNKAVPEDAKMLDWLDRQKNVTRYVKGLISDDMPGE